MLEAMSSEELSQWMAYMGVLGEEEKHRRDLVESGDGQVITYGGDDEEEDDDTDGDDGPTE
jgi:hypothetical protein